MTIAFTPLKNDIRTLFLLIFDGAGASIRNELSACANESPGVVSPFDHFTDMRFGANAKTFCSFA